MKRIESGVYETPDGRYRIERIDSLGDGWSESRQQTVLEVTTSTWVITERPERAEAEWPERGEYPTKRAAVEALKTITERESS
jgi:hypothetical protein